MIHALFIKIGATLVALGLSLGFVPVTPAPIVEQNVPVQTFGAFTPVGATQFSLAGAGINSTQTTITLASFTTPDGRPLTMTMFGSIGYGALEPQTVAKLEDITFSGITQNSNGSATLTGVTRGNDFISPYAPSSSLAYSHAGGMTFILTNTAGFYGQFAALQNNQTFTGNNTFTGQTTFTNFPITPSNTFANINVAGISQFATPAQQAGGIATSTNGTNAPLILSSQYATSTFVSKAQTANMVAVLNSLGHLDAGFVSSSTQFSVTGTTTLSATSSVSIGAFPAWDIGKQVQVFTNTGTSTFTVPQGVAEAVVRVVGGGGGTAGLTSVGLWSTFGTNGFYCSASGGNGSNGSVVGTGGIGTGGDINITGGTGMFAGAGTDGMGGSSAFGGPGAYGAGQTAAHGGGAVTGAGAGGYCEKTINFTNPATTSIQVYVSPGGGGNQGIVIVNW